MIVWPFPLQIDSQGVMASVLSLMLSSEHWHDPTAIIFVPASHHVKDLLPTGRPYKTKYN